MNTFELPGILVKNISLFEETSELQINMNHHKVRMDIINGSHVMFAYIDFNSDRDLGDETITWVSSFDFAKFLKLRKTAKNIYIDYDPNKRKIIVRTKGKTLTLHEITPTQKFVKCENAYGEMVDASTIALKKDIESVNFAAKIECNDFKWFKEIVEEGKSFGDCITFEKGMKLVTESTIGSMECNLREAYDQLTITGDLKTNDTAFALQFLETIAKIDMDHYTIDIGDMVPLNFNMSTDDGVKIWIALAPRVPEDNIGGI